jgi:hypothetical protein
MNYKYTLKKAKYSEKKSLIKCGSYTQTSQNPDIVIKRALDQLKKGPDYNLLFYNCEHLVNLLII